MKNKIKLLITGISGFLGNTFIHKKNNDFEIFGIYNNNIPITLTHNNFKSNITDKNKLEHIVTITKPDYIIHLAAISNANICEKQPLLSEQVNIIGTKNITDIAQKYSIKLLFTSTDLVFDGTNAPYNEQSNVSPISIYGTHKVMAEQIVSNYHNSTIFRLPLMFGKSYSNAKCFLQGMCESLTTGKETKLFSDEYRTPVSAEKITNAILNLRDTQEKILHLGGDTRINRVELGTTVANILHLHSPNIKSVLRSDVSMPAKRPEDTSLQNTLAKQNNFDPGNLFHELHKTLIM